MGVSPSGLPACGGAVAGVIPQHALVAVVVRQVVDSPAVADLPAAHELALRAVATAVVPERLLSRGAAELDVQDGAVAVVLRLRRREDAGALLQIVREGLVDLRIELRRRAVLAGEVRAAGLLQGRELGQRLLTDARARRGLGAGGEGEGDGTQDERGSDALHEVCLLETDGSSPLPAIGV